MDKKKILIAVGIFAAVVVGYFVYKHIMYLETDNAQVEGNTVMLAAKVGGYVLKVNVDDGQHVKKDDVLVEIDDRDQQAAVKGLKAELDAGQARRLEAERTFGRISNLYKSQSVSQAQYDQALASYNEVRGQYESLDAKLDKAQLDLEAAKVRAPVDGFVARCSVEVGQLVAPGVPLMGFVGSNDRWVTANFKETELNAVHIGAEADVDIDALPSAEYHGTVVSIDPATGATFSLIPPDNATGNFTKVVQRVPVRIKLANLNEKDVEGLRAGLSAVVKIHKH